ncbi:MAG: helix-turn-helix transcriptional regulator [Coleofasciculaceae cyanobacterium SM2_1_6]|nr:helix-turn-helix transcriptional regulator [Coleofasciculaceae cyanobacterium SM2_1_6]
MPNFPEEAMIKSDSQSDIQPEHQELCCEETHNYGEPDKLSPIRSQILSVEKAQGMAEFMNFLADTNRLRILSVLATGEMCVGDLAITLAMNESAVSHQLRTLRAIRLVNFRKQGRHVFYSLKDHHVLSFYQAIAEHLEEPRDDRD